jgi:hypothetical protein
MLSLYLQGSTTITTRLLCGPPNLLISYCRLTLMEWLALEQLRLVRIEIYQQGKVIWQSDTVTLRDLGQGCSATSLHSRGCLAARALKELGKMIRRYQSSSSRLIRGPDVTWLLFPLMSTC